MKRDSQCTTCGSGSIWHFARMTPGEVVVNAYIDTSKPYGEQESYALHVGSYREDAKRGIRRIEKSLPQP